MRYNCIVMNKFYRGFYSCTVLCNITFGVLAVFLAVTPYCIYLGHHKSDAPYMDLLSRGFKPPLKLPGFITAMQLAARLRRPCHLPPEVPAFNH